MLEMDLRNAIEDSNTNNFTAMLMRLLMKSDDANKLKIGSQYPVETQMVILFKTNCSYLDYERQEVDYAKIEERARAIVDNHAGCISLVVYPGDEE